MNARAMLLGLLLAAPAADAKDMTVRVDGHSVHLDVVAPARPVAGRPTIVFESGLAEIGTQTFGLVVPLLPTDVGYVRYDRPGYGTSEDDGVSPTPAHVANVLHTALANAGLHPPYVLVAHSLGGTRIRAFAGQFPHEVAALVFVEPTPDFTRTPEDDFHDVFEALGLGQKERAEMSQQDPPTGLAPVVLRELQMATAMQDGGFAELRSLPPIPDVPVVVLVGSSLKERPTSNPALSFDLRRWAERWLTVRNASLQRFAASFRQGTFVETGQGSHQLQNSEPELVAWAIARALSPRPAGPR